MVNMEHMYNFNVSDIRSQEYPMMRGMCLLLQSIRSCHLSRAPAHIMGP